MQSIVVRRTFEAATHPVGSAERARLNDDWRTSEYMPSHKYGIVGADGQRKLGTYRTKAEAESHAE